MGVLVGTVRLWDVADSASGRPALLLGPLAVDPSLKSAGIGKALMSHAISEAKRLGHQAILLVGDAPYYGRFGFSADKTGQLSMPGPYERHRFLALELVARRTRQCCRYAEGHRPQDASPPGSPRPPEKPLCHNDL